MTDPTPREDPATESDRDTGPTALGASRRDTCERCGEPIGHTPYCAPDCSAVLCFLCIRADLEAQP